MVVAGLRITQKLQKSKAFRLVFGLETLEFGEARGVEKSKRSEFVSTFCERDRPVTRCDSV